MDVTLPGEGDPFRTHYYQHPLCHCPSFCATGAAGVDITDAPPPSGPGQIEGSQKRYQGALAQALPAVGPWHWQCPQARAPPRPTPPQPVVLLARTACLQLDYCPQPDRQRQYRLHWRHGGHWWSHTGDLVLWPQAAPPSRHHPCPYYKQLTCLRTGLHRQWVGPAQAAPWSRPCRHAPLGAPELTERGGTAGH